MELQLLDDDAHYGLDVELLVKIRTPVGEPTG